jgi:DNA (cytosine-5)-methyltransferase 1
LKDIDLFVVENRNIHNILYSKCEYAIYIDFIFTSSNRYDRISWVYIMNLKCFDLFSGAGGLSEGFRQKGFNILFANDFDKYCEETYKLNHPETLFISGPIQNIEAKVLLNIADLRQCELDCIIGGPPCQAFSVYNHQRGMHDERSGLFREYLRLVKGLLPKFVVIENVPGMSSVDDGIAIKEIESGLRSLGYKVEHNLLKAEEYGVPQERRRLIFIGTRLPVIIKWPVPKYGIHIDQQYFTTVGDAISDLPLLEVGMGEEVQNYIMPPQNNYQELMRSESNMLYNHTAPLLSDINKERLKYIPQGGSWRDIPIDLLPSGMKKAKRSDHTKRYGRLRMDGLASTILTKCDPHWGAFFHPTQDRAISVREAARLQSFPDKTRFWGNKGEQYKQIGNAVPVLLAAAIAEVVRESLIDFYGSNEYELRSI